MDIKAIKRSMANRLEYMVGKDLYTATQRDWFNVAAYVARDRLMERWMETMRAYYRQDTKRTYYLSMEFLIGRTLANSLLNMGIYDELKQAFEEIGLDIEEIREVEPDAALGNGGLGRLAACFLDSMASMGIPGYGYGIRYEYGMFTQEIENGCQVEHPDNWLRYGNPWEFPRPEVLYTVKYYGRTVEYCDEQGKQCCHWVDTDDVMAMAYDTPIPGYQNNTTNNMRLWAAKSTREFELMHFNEGDYVKAVEEKNETENISKVLYPDDSTSVGKELRLKQQYFFVCASLQDILFRFLKHHTSLELLPEKVAIQLNDTHPAIAIPELMRVLIDVHQLDWDQAWNITTKTFAYTNHTLMPEALESWPVSLFEKMLPRHLKIIYDINYHFLNDIMHHAPGDMDLLNRMSIIDEHGEKTIRMAHLAIIGSHKVNGVAKLHTELMKSTIFRDFHRFAPDKFINMTNGITPRRWLNHANPELARLITQHIGDDWVTDLSKIKGMESLANNKTFRDQFRGVKLNNKKSLAKKIYSELGLEINTDSLFDVHIKRIHEYKRQLLNILHVVTLYNRIRQANTDNMVPRTVMFAGKAAPGYATAKLIIRLINDIADIVNNDPAIGNMLKVVFIPNYDVSTAATIIPAAELSEQTSTAGTEASGTGNMKLALNGALTIGTLDGATVEIREEVGEENIFIFGHTTDEIQSLKHHGYNPWDYYYANAELKQVIDMINSGFFSPDHPDIYKPLVESLTDHGDHFMVLADYQPYVECQEKVASLYKDQDEWTRKAIINVANMGKFSSDRTIGEYAEKIWNVSPVDIELNSEGHAQI
ncbi:MAG: glycogen/starch/alpha-glucan phosphorylase [Gammaproteobacteria bacterium]